MLSPDLPPIRYVQYILVRYEATHTHVALNFFARRYPVRMQMDFVTCVSHG